MKIKESEKRNRYLDLARELTKLLNKKRMTVIPVVTSALIIVPTRLKELEIGTNRNHPHDNTAEIGQNTEKSLGDLRILVVTQTPV